MSSRNKVLSFIGIIVVAWLAANANRKSPSPSTTPAALPVQAPAQPVISVAESNANLELCRAKLKAAAKLNLLSDMSFDNGRPKVVVGPTWHRIDFSAKEGLAQTAACFFLAGDSTKAIRFEITDNMTGKSIATWSGTRLRVE